MTSNELIRKYNHQRRRNARTIRERNETIRRLEEKAEAYREIADDRRWACEVLREVAQSLLAENKLLRRLSENLPEVSP